MIEFLEYRIAPASVAYAVGIGGSKADDVHDVGVDTSGNVYVSGSFRGTVDLDPGPGVFLRTAPEGREWGYVAKFTSAGVFAWASVIAVTAGDPDDIQLAVTPAGDVYLSTDFSGTDILLSDPTGQLAGGNLIGGLRTLFVAKIATSGLRQWGQVFGSLNGVSLAVSDIASDHADGVYLAGTYSAAASPGIFNFAGSDLAARAGDTNLFVVKLQDQGNVAAEVWGQAAASTAASATQVGRSFIAANAAGEVAVSGQFTASLSFQTGVVTTIQDPASGIFVARLDSAGIWQAAGQIGTAGAGRTVSGVLIDEGSNLYVGGSFSTLTDFDPTAALATIDPGAESDGFLMKLTPALSPVFGYPRTFFFGSSPVTGGPMTLGGDGFIRIAYEGDHPVVLKYAPDGNLFERVDFEVLKGAQGFAGIAGDPLGGLYVARTFTSPVDADPSGGKLTVKSRGLTDGLLAHYFPAGFVAQPAALPFVKSGFTLGGSGDEDGKQLAIDAAGNRYVAGIFSGTLDFDPGPATTPLTSSTGSVANFFVAKYAPSGTLVWVRKIETAVQNLFEGDPPIRLALDDAGNVFVAGEYEGPAGFGTVTLPNADPVGSGRTDLFFAKYDAAGTLLWARSIGSAGANETLEASALRGSTGQFVVSGSFAATTDFDPGPGTVSRTPTDNPDSFILSLNSDGTFGWVRHLTNEVAARSSVAGLAFLAGGDVVATGFVSRKVDFNAGGAPLELTGDLFDDIYVARFSGATGVVAWAEKFGGDRYDQGRAIAVSPGDEIVVGGHFSTTVDFDPGSGVRLHVAAGGQSQDYFDGFVLKLSDAGLFIDAASFGSPDRDEVRRLQVDAAGAVLVGGVAGLRADLDPGAGLFTLPAAGPFLTRLTSTLDFLSARPLPGEVWSVDAQGEVLVTGSFQATADLDPSTTQTKVTSKGQRDIFVMRYSSDGEFDALHPRTFFDQDGDRISVTLSGPGTGKLTLIGDAQHLANLARIELTDTTLESTLNVSIAKSGDGLGFSTLEKILTTQTQQHLGSISVARPITFGDGTADTLTDLKVSGKLNALTMGDIAPNTLFSLGRDLPYDITTDTTTPDTYNHRPRITLNRILGSGVEIAVIGDGVTPQGIGGGGLGNITIASWSFPGFIRTTQSIGDFTITNADLVSDTTCRVDLLVDSESLGAGTIADCGEITVNGGAWGSTGTEIEGNIEAFDADAFLTGARITAGSIGGVSVAGNFSGEIILTDPDSPTLPTFTVDSNYVGVVKSAAPLKKLKIKGDFVGSLEAPSIGAITAYSFLGSESSGVPVTYIRALDGGLGTLTATAGPVQNFEIVTSQVFKGFKVNVGKLTSTTIGLDNVHITAASIGNIAVTLRADAKATGLNLIGIRNSSFTTTNLGTTASTAGTIGNIAVTINGVAAGTSATGIANSTFDALVGDLFGPDSTVNSLGSITVKLSGQGGTNVGLSDVSFSANTIGNTSVTVNRAAGATARAAELVSYVASGNVGSLTFTGDATVDQVAALEVWSGANIGAVTVKSKNPIFGSLVDSAILAGQALVLNGATAAEQTAKLGRARLGAINVSGSLLDTDLVAGGSVGSISVGREMNGSLVLAGATLGADQILGGSALAADTFQRAATIGAVTVRGTLAASSLAAGVSPGNTTFGDGDDIAAAAPAFLGTVSAIGAVNLAQGAILSSAPLPGNAITAGKITSLKVGAISTTIFPAFLDLGPAGEDSSDVVVRVI